MEASPLPLLVSVKGEDPLLVVVVLPKLLSELADAEVGLATTIGALVACADCGVSEVAALDSSDRELLELSESYEGPDSLNWEPLELSDSTVLRDVAAGVVVVVGTAVGVSAGACVVLGGCSVTDEAITRVDSGNVTDEEAEVEPELKAPASLLPVSTIATPAATND
ncbi:hypothetical protein PRIC1_014346 [Phytophthora ramorum]